MKSAAFDAVSAAQHPDPADGGPCATCAFRSGSEASRTDYTVALAVSCVEGLVPFHCHEKDQLCRGWIAAVNLNGPPTTREQRRHQKAAAMVADAIGQAIEVGKAAEREARRR